MILGFAKADAQFKLLADCRYYYDSTGYVLHDSTRYFYAPANTTSCTQDLTEGWVSAMADSMHAFTKNDTTLAMDRHTRTLWSYTAAYDKRLSETYFYYINNVLQFDGNYSNFWSGNLLDSVRALVTYYPAAQTVDNYRVYFNYNASSLRDTSWYVYYNAAGAFSSLHKYSYSFYPNNLEDESYEWESLDSVTYVEKNKTKKYYNANNMLDSTIGYVWNLGQWYKIYKHEYSYNANQMKQSFAILYFDQNQQIWLPNTKKVFLRSNGTEVDTIYEMSWNQGANQFDTTWKSGFTYINGFLTKRYAFNYNALQNQWVPNQYGAMYEYHYDQIPNSIHEPVTKVNSLTVFPNPASEQISFDAGTQRCLFSISGMDGKVFITGTAEGRSNVDTKSLANGLYIITLQQGSNKLSNTFLKR
jgi:hypothetical protein